MSLSEALLTITSRTTGRNPLLKARNHPYRARKARGRLLSKRRDLRNTYECLRSTPTAETSRHRGIVASASIMEHKIREAAKEYLGAVSQDLIVRSMSSPPVVSLVRSATGNLQPELCVAIRSAASTDYSRLYIRIQQVLGKKLRAS
jgi:hypothetical protein